MIHDDRVEGAVLRAEATIHADVYIDVELGRLGNRAARIWIVRTYDPDTLWRTDLGANSAGCAAHFLLSFWLFIVDQEGDKTHLFRRDQSLFGILNRKYSFRI